MLNRRKGFDSVALTAVFAAFVGTGAQGAVPGVGEDSVVFGQSAVFSGPNQNLGCQYQAGILGAFDEVNATGGVKGRLLHINSMDDSYEPERAVDNAESFVAEDQVLAVIGAVGTPPARRSLPIYRDAAIPVIGLYTGADFVYDKERFPNVVSLRASYADETRLLAAHLLGRLGKSRFGVVYQDDSFGRGVLNNFRDALEEENVHILAKAAYTRNAHSFHSAFFTVEPAALDALLLVGSNAANGELIRLANSLELDYVMANVSFVNSSELSRQIERNRENVIVTEVMPDPLATDVPLVNAFRRAMTARETGVHNSCFDYDYGLSAASLEGYALGRFLAAVLERMPEEMELNRENLLSEALRPDPIDIDGWRFEFPPGSNSGTRYVRLIDLAGYDSDRDAGGAQEQ